MNNLRSLISRDKDTEFPETSLKIFSNELARRLVSDEEFSDYEREIEETKRVFEKYPPEDFARFKLKYLTPKKIIVNA